MRVSISTEQMFLDCEMCFFIYRILNGARYINIAIGSISASRNLSIQFTLHRKKKTFVLPSIEQNHIRAHYNMNTCHVYRTCRRN